VNDASWRNLSAILGVACVILIIAAGALLATSGESATPTTTPVANVSTGDATPTAPRPSGSVGPSITATPTATAIVGPTASPAPKAPIVAITFNNVRLDASTDIAGKPRTFTFITDGVGPVGITMTKSTTALSRICVTVDNSKPDCRTGTKVNYKGAFTDTAHSLWTVTLVGYQTNTPTLDIAFSWPSNTGKISYTHGRFQGSSSPNVPETLNGFTATFKTRAAGNINLSASWTAITPDVGVTLSTVSGANINQVDSKQFSAAQNLGTSGYTFAVALGQTYRLALRNLSADSQRPDLSAVITVP
jgi:hypothetical protein